MPNNRLFEPLTLRGTTLKNRVMVAPMAMYSAQDGVVNDFHLVHLGRFALGGAGLVMMEATAVSPHGRITPGCAGIWSDTQIDGLKKISSFIKQSNSIAAIQLGHSGRKGATRAPWRGGAPLPSATASAAGEDVAWPLVSSMGEAFEPGGLVPTQLDEAGILQIVDEFADAATRADQAGFDVLEVHCAHGYLLHSFLSPLANRRDDGWGGDLAHRMRFPLMTVQAVRGRWPSHKPLFVRISSVDGVGAGWSIEDSVAFCKALKEIGVDVIDCSSGGMKLPRGARLVARTEGFHVPFASRIRREVNIPTVAVGLIQSPEYAANLLERGDAELIAIAREALFDPNWPNRAATAACPETGWDVWPIQFSMWLKGREETLRRNRIERN
jgi:2,4-dienoyl-CoA reductase-like NADH-dependent reductase (Old Yellow Enzyme family)